MTDQNRAGAGAMARIVLATAVLPLMIAVAGAALVGSWRDELPSKVATHWGVDGTADGFSSVTAVLVLVVGFGIVFALAGLILGLVLRHESTLIRVVAGTVAGIVAMVTVLVAWLTADQRGMSDAATADAPASRIVVSLAIGIVVAVAAARLVPAGRPGPVSRRGPDPDAPRVALGADERVVWSRSVASGSLPVAVMVVAVGLTAAIGLLSRQWWVLALTVALAVLIVATFAIRATVDQAGLTIRGRFGWPRSHIPLSEIQQAEVQTVRPIRDFGGYGYRIAAFGPLRGARGYVLRGGDALVVEVTNGGRFVVVVDDSVTAAGLLNALLERERSH